MGLFYLTKGPFMFSVNQRIMWNVQRQVLLLYSVLFYFF